MQRGKVFLTCNTCNSILKVVGVSEEDGSLLVGECLICKDMQHYHFYDQGFDHGYAAGMADGHKNCKEENVLAPERKF